MILKKLQETLDAVLVQKESLTEIEAQLRGMILKLTHADATLPSGPLSDRSLSFGFVQEREPLQVERDKIDDVVEILRVAGKPLHINAIAAKLSELRGVQIKRVQLEPGLNRHVSRTKRPKVAKFGPSIFGLPEWKGNSPAESQEVA